MLRDSMVTRRAFLGGTHVIMQERALRAALTDN